MPEEQGHSDGSPYTEPHLDGELAVHHDTTESPVMEPAEKPVEVTPQQVAAEFANPPATELHPEEPETYEQDVAKAETIAIAENPDRTLAADYRTLANSVETFDRGKETTEQSAERFIEDHSNNTALNSLTPTQENYVIKKALEPQKVGNEGDYLRDKGEMADNRANREGEWAAVLLEHPVEPSYLENLGVKDVPELTPGVLEGAEAIITANNAEMEKWENKLAELEAEVAENGGNMATALVEEVGRIWGIDSEAVKKLHELCKKDDTTIGDMKRYFATLCSNRNKAAKMVNNLLEKVLEDVRSGNTGEPAEVAQAA